MNKKLTATILSAAMAVSLAACGTGAPAPAKAPADTAEAAATGQTLTVWCWDAFNIDAMKKAAEIYNREHPDVTIDIQETLAKDIRTLVQTYAVGGELDSLPDIFLMDDQVIAKYIQNYPEVFTDLTDSGIDFSQFASSKVANSVSGGKNYGVPYDSNTVVAA